MYGSFLDSPCIIKHKSRQLSGLLNFSVVNPKLWFMYNISYKNFFIVAHIFLLPLLVLKSIPIY